MASFLVHCYSNIPCINHPRFIYIPYSVAAVKSMHSNLREVVPFHRSCHICANGNSTGNILPPMALEFCELQVSTIWGKQHNIVTNTSLPSPISLSPRRSHSDQCHPGQNTYFATCINNYFNIFKFWFTLRASASAVAPELPTLFPSRLWKRVFRN